MFGIGPPELVVIAVLFLVVFGPSKMPQMALDIGKFIGQARGAIDEFKDEITAETETSDRPTRNREEGSRRRKNSRTKNDSSDQEDDYPRDDQEEEDSDLEDGSSESTKRERAEYDL